MLTKVKRKQISLLLVLLLTVTTIIQGISPALVYADGTSTKQEIVHLQFAAAADEANGVIQAPSTVPYTNSILGISIDTNAVYTGLSSTNTIRATNWSVDKYWQFGFKADGFENYSISFNPRSSSTAPRDFKIQYSTDTINWYDVANSDYQVTTEYTVTKSFNLPDKLSDLDSLSIRMICTSTVAVNGSTVASTGANNISNIVLYGTPVGGENSIVVKPVDSNYPSESIISDADEIELSSPSVASGSAIEADLSGDTGSEDNIATGGAIYFAVNDGNYQTYLEPFTLSEFGADESHTEFTINAYAEVDGNKSEITSFHYYTKDPNAVDPTPEAEDPISAEMAAASGASAIDSIYSMSAGQTATVIGQVAYKYGNVYNGANSINTILLQDVINGEIIGLQIYDTSHTYQIGDIVTVTGTVGEYGKVKQLSTITAVNTIGTAAAFKPQVLTIGELLSGGDKYLSEYILIQNATLGTYSSTGNTLITDSTGQINLYKGALLPEGMAEGDTVNLYAAWSKYNTTYQLRNGVSTDYVKAGAGGVTVDTSIVLPVAAWAGTGQITNPVVYGDKYNPNDYLDTSAKFTHSSGTIPQLTSTSGGNTNYYLGTKGSTEGTYYQLEFDAIYYGNINLSYTMKGSNTGPKNFKILYSTDGINFIEASGKVLSLSAASTWETFSDLLPEAANHADTLYIRIQVADSVSINNGTIGSGGTNYIGDIKITGSPVVTDDIVGYPQISPDAGEVKLGDEITITSQTKGATIYYSFDGVSYQVYDSSNKPVFSQLPATVTAYAVKAGLTDSLLITYGYTQEQAAVVNATPNGGAKTIGTKVTLTCDTEGAVILYSVDNGVNWTTYDPAVGITLETLPVDISAKAVLTGCKDSETSVFKFTQRLNENYNIYFGQLHAHTDYSDGAGTCEQAFDYAKNTAEQIDFLAITDHSNSFDNADSASLADGSVSSEWKEGHELADKYTDSDFVGIYGFEMTWSNGLGHINTFDTPGFQSRTQTKYAAYSTALSNYYETLKTQPESISQFNHPGTTFGDFSDFDHYDAEIDKLISIIEVGNGEGAIGSSGYFPSYEYYTRALDKGWHVAPTNNQDNHKGYWGDANTARTVILADSLTRDNIYDAMRNMRVYATEDNDLQIQYTLNDEVMGTIIENKPDSVKIKVDLKDPTDSAIGKVEVIVNGGLSVGQETISGNEGTVEFNLSPEYSYYYIRVTEPDKDIAVTAPVWVGETESSGISSISTTAVLPVKGEALDINTKLFNNEDKELNIESIDYSIDDEVIHSVDLASAGLTSVAAFKTADYSFKYTYNGTGSVKIKVTVKAALDGVTKVYNSILSLDYVDPSMVTNVVVDGTHYNDYVTGYYGGNMGNFTDIAADENIKVNIVTDKITEDTLADCDLLIISAPAKKSGTANAGAYTTSHFEDDFIQLVKAYTDKGGTVILCGLADYSDTADGQTSTEINKLLEAIGATTRLNSDEAVDDVSNGGQAYRLYLDQYNEASVFNNGVSAEQLYSAYSGCTLLLNENAVAEGKVEYLVKGHDTTYSLDTKQYDSNYKAIEKGNAVMLAREELPGGSNVFIAGTVFMSDFEVKVEIDNNWDLPYSNKTIITNILDYVKKEMAISCIADVRNGTKGEIYSVEGTVTAGTVSGNAFFDTIYIQDETGGINIFPINEGLIEAGQKVKVTGYLDEYLGDKELRVITAEVTDTNKAPLTPAQVTTKEAMDYAVNGGKLVKVQGTVTDVVLKNDVVETISVKDESGAAARVFVDGYIKYSDENSKALEGIVKVGNVISAVGLVSYDTEGERIRVRDRSEILLVKEGGTGTDDPGTNNPGTDDPDDSGNHNNNSSKNQNSTKQTTSATVVDQAANTKTTTTVTTTKDSLGNTVTTTVKVVIDLTTGNTVNKEITTVVDIQDESMINQNNTVTISSEILADALKEAADSAAKESPLKVIIHIPSDKIILQLRNTAFQAVHYRVELPTSITNDSTIQITDIIIPEAVLTEAKEGKKDFTFTLEEKSGKKLYSWSFSGSDLKASSKEITDINTYVQVNQVADLDPVNEAVNPYLPAEYQNQGVVLSFKHHGVLPAPAVVSIFVGNQKGLAPGTKVYVYYFNEELSAGGTSGPRLEEGRKVEATIDENGYIQIPISHCSNYVVLPVEPDAAIVATLFEQIGFRVDKTLYLDKTVNVKLSMPLEAEGAVVTYLSGNKTIATVDKNGKITPKSAGKTEITAKVTINGITKTYSAKVTVKEPYIKITEQETSLQAGDTFTYEAKAYGVTGNLVWETSDKSIAVINKYGKLTAKKPGKVKVTAKVKGVKTTITVEIK